MKLLSSQSRRYPHFTLREDLLEHADGRTQPYTFVQLATDAAVVLAHDAQGRWLLTREYRYPTGKKLLGCPGGRLEVGEEPRAGALREFREETGYQADELIDLGAFYPLSGITDQKIHCFYAPQISFAGAPQFDPFENITIEWTITEQLYHTDLTDGVLCNALLRYQLYKKTL